MNLTTWRERRAARRLRRRQRRILDIAVGALHAPCSNVTCSCHAVRAYAAAKREALR